MSISSTLTDPDVALALWALAHGGAIAAVMNNAVRTIPSAVPVARIFIFTVTG